MLLLDRREARRRRNQLIHFWDGVALHVHCGFDLAYAWSEVLRGLTPVLCVSLVELLASQGEESFTTTLVRLSRTYPDSSHRLWFTVFHTLYVEGAPLTDAVSAAAQALRKEQERDLETHCRRLPGQLNLRILLFFLPPTFLLLFFPLLMEWGLQ